MAVTPLIDKDILIVVRVSSGDSLSLGVYITRVRIYEEYVRKKMFSRYIVSHLSSSPGRSNRRSFGKKFPDRVSRIDNHWSVFRNVTRGVTVVVRNQ